MAIAHSVCTTYVRNEMCPLKAMLCLNLFKYSPHSNSRAQPVRFYCD